jgi:hypothetical protein
MRFVLEQRAVEKRFPRFVLSRRLDGCLVWMGSITTSVEGRRYHLQIVYPLGFPGQPPEVSILSPLIADGPHLLGPGHPCLYHSGSRVNGYNPAATTAATLIAWVSLWCHCREVWERTGRWPGAED